MKKLKPIKAFADTLRAVRRNTKSFAAFSAASFAFCAAGFEGLGGFGSLLFLPVMVLYYAFWIYFFRFYFGRKPYFAAGRIWVSLVPSTKIMLISAIVVLIVACLPFLPLVPMLWGGGIDPQSAEEYLNFLSLSLEQSRLMNALSMALFVVLSPVIFFRPFMAWIDSVVGRAGSIREAMDKTKGNYWRFCLAGLLMGLPFLAADQLAFYFPLPRAFYWAILSPLTVYYNMVLARIYKVFFIKSK